MSTMTVTMIEYGPGYDKSLPHTLAGTIAELSSALAAIPEEYRESAEFDIEPDYSHGEVFQHAIITYRRPMAPGEIEAQNAEERAHWDEQLRNARARVLLCKEELAALGAAPTSVGAA